MASDFHKFHICVQLEIEKINVLRIETKKPRKVWEARRHNCPKRSDQDELSEEDVIYSTQIVRN